MNKLASKWTCRAVLYLPGKTVDDTGGTVLREGQLAELIAFAVEELREPVQSAAHISCDDIMLGFEAMRSAYHGVDFPPGVGKWPRRKPVAGTLFDPRQGK